nr:hypothetical protein [Leptospira adleri]
MNPNADFEAQKYPKRGIIQTQKIVNNKAMMVPAERRNARIRKSPENRNTDLTKTAQEKEIYVNS